ncbi:helix-turn-helix domain-containing protein [Solicola gregarius]|uniref:LuxR C-terminal-related transcriptional regulator n=1 Tax=Solicola gregarius TaxID=2908642 RepID=A0AA46TFW5_9ACTN|nr:helix-turn-helix domain-containing protein [Solicola gregarius]UYM04067.1 LuxR C-terminal-related transcriptional regulator [Solicola gregarius]
MLEHVGVSPEDESTYRALLRRPQCTVRELAEQVDRPPDLVRRSARRLEELGLLSRTPDHPARLVPTRPDLAVDVLVAARRADLDRAQAGARELLDEMSLPDQYRPESLLEVLTGQDAIAARFAQLVRATERELLVLDRPPYASGAGDSEPRVLGLLGDGVTVHGIYSPDSLQIPGAVEGAYSAADAGERSRIHPAVPMKLAIADRSVALLPLVVDRMVDSALVVHRSALLDALVQMFFLLWDQGVPVVGDSDASDLDRRLLTMLAAGMKDDTIARHLDISSRTVGRRVAELMDRIGAKTRFEAGVHAQRRGLLAD